MEFNIRVSVRVQVDSFTEVGALADLAGTLFGGVEAYGKVDVVVFKISEWELEDEEEDTDAGV